jgi:predicted DNA-binding transcriptional regulator YafY
MRAGRLLSLLLILQRRGQASADTLARELAVSVRTVHRDLAELSAAGVPIHAERGRHGGFVLAESHRSNLAGLAGPGHRGRDGLSPGEAAALLLVGVGRAAVDLGLGADADAARRKLLSSLPPALGEAAARVADRFHLDPVPWYRQAEPTPHLPALAAAVWQGRTVRVRYDSWKREVERELEPIGLVLKGGLWYLVARVGTSTRTYRVARMLAVEETGRAFTRPRAFDLAASWDTWAREFEARMLPGHATVRLSPTGRARLRDLMPAAAAAVDAAHPTRARRAVIADIPVEATAHAARQLLALGAEVEVLAPAALRRAVGREASRLARSHRRAVGRR